MHRFALADIAPTPWKNGGGATREIACWPPGAGLNDFDARISVATIAADGPFSAFPGIDRSITLLTGDGVRLTGPGIDHRLNEVGAPFAFDGDLPLHAHLLGGATDDFNVMTRRGRCRAQVTPLRAATHWACEGTGLLLAVRGAWKIAGSPHADAPDAGGTLQAGEGLWWNDGSGVLACAPVASTAPVLLLAVTLAFHDS